MSKITELIAAIPLFASLPRIEIERLVKNLRSFEVPENTLIFREGNRDNRFYILVEGQVEIIKKFTLPSEGHIELTLPAIVVENATLIPYKVCVFSEGKDICLESEFVIWNSP